MLRNKPLRKKITRRKPVKAKKNSRLLEMAIVAIFALVLIYGASFAIRITHGFSRTVETPEYVVRLQVLNGCGIDGAAGHIAGNLSRKVKLPLEAAVLDIGDFSSYHVAETFLISRHENLKPVKILARQLGLPTDNITYRPIENNYQNLTATLVLGDDYKEIFQIN